MIGKVSGDQEPLAVRRAGGKRSRDICIQSFGCDRPYKGPFGRTPSVKWVTISHPIPAQPRIVRPAPRKVYQPPVAQSSSGYCAYKAGREAHVDELPADSDPSQLPSRHQRKRQRKGPGWQEQLFQSWFTRPASCHVSLIRGSKYMSEYDSRSTTTDNAVMPFSSCC